MSETSELQQLYRQTVLDHSRNPQNFRRIDDADMTALGHNPLCGDKLTVYVKGGEVIEDIAFEGAGCAISIASASIMSAQAIGQTAELARNAIDETLRGFEDRDKEPPIDGEMAALGGVRAYPSRVKCATLAWKTLRAALNGRQETVTTEE